jgi:hypothetical protein
MERQNSQDPILASAIVLWVEVFQAQTYLLGLLFTLGLHYFIFSHALLCFAEIGELMIVQISYMEGKFQA